MGLDRMVSRVLMLVCVANIGVEISLAAPAYKLTGGNITVPTSPTTSTTPEVINGWEIRYPAGDTACIYDTEYAFYYRPGKGENADKLVIEFEGGGACWNEATCKIPVFKVDVEPTKATTDESYDFNVLLGIHTDDDRNALSGHSWLFIPYCTGDIHVGSTKDTVNGVNFNGRANAQSALDWIQDNFKDPKEVFTFGTSAGALATLCWMPWIIEMYPRSTHNQFLDSYVGVISPQHMVNLLDAWNMVAAIFPPLGITKEILIAQGNDAAQYMMEVNSQTYPQVFFSYYTSNADLVQNSFYTLGGGTFAKFTAQLRDHLYYFRKTENIGFYINFGNSHVVTSDANYFIQGIEDSTYVHEFVNLAVTSKLQGSRNQYLDCCPDFVPDVKQSNFTLDNATAYLIKQGYQN